MGIAERLKEERIRLGLSQVDFAAIGGAHRKSQGNYESGERFPDAPYLAAIAEAGADVQYIVTGERSDMALTPDERELLALFRSAPLAVKAAAIGALQGAAASQPAAPAFNQTFHGSVGPISHVAGDQTFNKPVTIGVRTIRKKKNREED